MADDAGDLDDADEGQDDTGHVNSPRVGWFRFFFDHDRWEWSPEVQRMHGYAPGEVEPTTELILSHKHPDDVGQVAATIEAIRRTREPFTTRHRIRDVSGAIHYVVVVGGQLRDDDGTVVGTEGFYIDVTPDLGAHQDDVTAAVAKIAENRSIIDVSKGMLMVIYGIDEATAFDLLKWRSQTTNVKLRLLARQIVTDFGSHSRRRRSPVDGEYDHLLLTAHLRIDDQSGAA